MGSMVSEIILCVKEVNQKTRTAAYELLVSLARAMHEQHPPPMALMGQDADVEMGQSLNPCPCACTICLHLSGFRTRLLFVLVPSMLVDKLF